MGRAKLKMELISSQKFRYVTFQKRKKGLKKKAYELSTLCSVQCCMILYGPKLDRQPIELEIWPADESELLKVISSYMKLSLDDRKKRTLDLSDVFESRKRKAEDALMKLRKGNEETRYPTWSDGYNHLFEEQLTELRCFLDAKIVHVRERLQMLMKANQVMPASGMMDGLPTSSTEAHDSNFMPAMLRGRRIEFEVTREQPISMINQFDVNLAFPYPFNQSQSQSLPLSHMGLPFDANLMTASISKPDHFSPQFPGASNSSNTFCNRLTCYNLASGQPEGVVVNNHRPPTCYYNLARQPVSLYMQFPGRPSMHD